MSKSGTENKKWFCDTYSEANKIYINDTENLPVASPIYANVNELTKNQFPFAQQARGDGACYFNASFAAILMDCVGNKENWNALRNNLRNKGWTDIADEIGLEDQLLTCEGVTELLMVNGDDNLVRRLITCIIDDLNTESLIHKVKTLRHLLFGETVDENETNFSNLNEQVARVKDKYKNTSDDDRYELMKVSYQEMQNIEKVKMKRERDTSYDEEVTKVILKSFYEKEVTVITSSTKINGATFADDGLYVFNANSGSHYDVLYMGKSSEKIRQANSMIHFVNDYEREQEHKESEERLIQESQERERKAEEERIRKGNIRKAEEKQINSIHESIRPSSDEEKAAVNVDSSNVGASNATNASAPGLNDQVGGDLSSVEVSKYSQEIINEFNILVEGHNKKRAEDKKRAEAAGKEGVAVNAIRVIDFNKGENFLNAAGENNTYLMEQIAEGHNDFVLDFLNFAQKHKIDIGINKKAGKSADGRVDYFGNTAMHLAVAKGYVATDGKGIALGVSNLEIVEKLLEMGADPTIFNRQSENNYENPSRKNTQNNFAFSYTPLDLAAIRGDSKMFLAIIEKGIFKKEDLLGFTKSLVEYAEEGKMDVNREIERTLLFETSSKVGELASFVPFVVEGQEGKSLNKSEVLSGKHKKLVPNEKLKESYGSIKKIMAEALLIESIIQEGEYDNAVNLEEVIFIKIFNFVNTEVENAKDEDKDSVRESKNKFVWNIIKNKYPNYVGELKPLFVANGMLKGSPPLSQKLEDPSHSNLNSTSKKIEDGIARSSSSTVSPGQNKVDIFQDTVSQTGSAVILDEEEKSIIDRAIEKYEDSDQYEQAQGNLEPLKQLMGIGVESVSDEERKFKSDLVLTYIETNHAKGVTDYITNLKRIIEGKSLESFFENPQTNELKENELHDDAADWKKIDVEEVKKEGDSLRVSGLRKRTTHEGNIDTKQRRSEAKTVEEEVIIEKDDLRWKMEDGKIEVNETQFKKDINDYYFGREGYAGKVGLEASDAIPKPTVKLISVLALQKESENAKVH